MIISFVRHGESEANVLHILSSREEEPYNLTDRGINQIEEVSLKLGGKIDAIYTSPFPRTMQSAKIIVDKQQEHLDIIVDRRITEIGYGEYNGKPNNEELDEIRRRQINGDYEIRFGMFGENKHEIFTRICSFLVDVLEKHSDTEHIVVVSHGAIIGIAEQIIVQIKKIQKGSFHADNASVKSHILDKNDLGPFKDEVKRLNAIKQKSIQKRLEIVNKKFRYFKDIDKKVQDRYLQNYANIAKDGFDNVELNNKVLEQMTDGFFVSDIKSIQKQIDRSKLKKDDVVLICAFKNAENLVELFINHYIKMGINNFVFIDNNSTDKSIEIIKTYYSINTDIWSTDDKFASFKSCGWRQRMIAYYGVKRWYLDLDIDELFVYQGSEKGGIKKIISYAKKTKIQTIGAIMLDAYPNKPLLNVKKSKPADIQKMYRYIDIDTYFIEANDNYKNRIFGGPRKRKFNVTPSLQKYPLVYIKPNTIKVNPHFWYPFDVNFNSQLVSALLHYKFLPGDLEQYEEYTKSGIYWNNSEEYRVYVKGLHDDSGLNFFEKEHSMEYSNSIALVNIKNVNGEKLILKIK